MIWSKKLIEGNIPHKGLGKPIMVAHACNPSIGEAEAGG
jgi:hypothetical protein